MMSGISKINLVVLFASELRICAKLASEIEEEIKKPDRDNAKLDRLINGLFRATRVALYHVDRNPGGHMVVLNNSTIENCIEESAQEFSHKPKSKESGGSSYSDAAPAGKPCET